MFAARNQLMTRDAAPSFSPVLHRATTSLFTNTNNFSTSLSASGAVDLSPYAGIPNLALVVSACYYANGGGNVSHYCRYNSVNMTLMAGLDRTAGNNYGGFLYIMQNPPTTGSLTLLSNVTGTANTGRNAWLAATLWSNVGSWDNGAVAYNIASGVGQTIAVGTNEVAVNTMMAGQNFSTYSQTSRVMNAIALLRAVLGDAAGDGSGTKVFTSTGGGYSSLAARLKPAA